MQNRIAVLLLGLVTLSGCGGDGFKTPDPDSCAVYLWEPGDGQFETWPAMEYLGEDPSTATGHRFDIDAERFPRLTRYGSYARVATEQLATLDGFGVNATAWAEFSRPFDQAQLPRAGEGTRPDDPVGLIVFGDAGPELWPVEIRAVPDSFGEARLLAAVPLVPLPETSEVAFFVTRHVVSASVDGCVSTSAGARPLIEEPTGAEARSVAALVELGVVDEPTDLVVLQPFVTQSIHHESVAIAEDIASRPDEAFSFDVDLEEDCATFARVPSYRYCTAGLEVVDYRDAAGHIVFDASDRPIRHSVYTLRVHLWIPAEQSSAPHPMILFGHGLNGDSLAHAAAVLPHAAEQGSEIVVVGVDALEHGNHPDRRSVESEPLFDFFAIEIPATGPQVDSLRLRDNFRQSTYDKLQVTRAILAQPDLDADGAVDVDVDRMSYVGASLGAIMGGELLALTDRYESAVLSMPGGRVTAIINDDESQFSALIPLLLPHSLGFNSLEVEKVFSVLQTAIDRGDAASHAARVFENRSDPESIPPDVLVLVALGDDTVPNAENYAFARAMGLGIVPPERAPALGLSELPYPHGEFIGGNMAGGDATGGLIQFDVIERPNGVVTGVTHGNLTESRQSTAAIFHFLESSWEQGMATTVDPYLQAPLD